MSDKKRVNGLARYGVAVSLTAVLALTSVSCGGSNASSEPAANEAADGSPSAERGLSIANSRGCSGCHGPSFQGGAGPGWVGLAGSEVELIDGTVVIADDDYLVRAIADPVAELRAGFSLRMPSNGLSDAEIADVVEFIKTLNADNE
jgi:cytochrome c oxidase subunit 2